MNSPDVRQDFYPGGTFNLDSDGTSIAVQLARVGRASLGIEFAPDLPIEDQALGTFYTLGRAPSLLILDNVQSEQAIRPWLPLSRMPCHVIITTVLDCWDRSWMVVRVDPLPDPVSLDLVERLVGTEIASRHGARLVAFAGGLPVQLVSRCLTLAKDVRRRGDAVIEVLTDHSQKSFRGVYDRLAAESRLLLHAAARLNAQRIIVEELERHLIEGAGWTADVVARHLEACLDVQVLQGDAELRMHQLFVTFVRNTLATAEIAERLHEVVKAQARRLVEIAQKVAVAPNRVDLAAILMTYPISPRSWTTADVDISLVDITNIGRALEEIGQFEAARSWFERAVEEKERGDVHGRIDHASLGKSLHQVGYCLWNTGDFDAARSWFERAVAEKEKGDIQGRIDYTSVGSSMHHLAHCFFDTGDFDGARLWYERAFVEKKKGDIQGRIDHGQLGGSFYRLGYCLFNIGDFDAARPWFERAVLEFGKGNIHGQVDHLRVGRGLHKLGNCFFSTGEFDAARSWFERAVTEKEKGDIHGRVHHESLGKSLHEVAGCIWETGDFMAARLFYERAVTEQEKGDIYGRVNHESLGYSLRAVASCLRKAGQQELAIIYDERAAMLDAEREGLIGPSRVQP